MVGDRSALPEQFILCRDPRHVPGGWPTHVAKEWTLGHHPSLPVVQLSDRDGSAAGWLVGYAIDDGGVLLEHGDTAVTPATLDEVEAWVYLHGGRFAVIVVTALGERLYLDPSGSLSAVYCPALECVASTTSLIPRNEDTQEIAEDMRAVGIPGVGMYPLHLTPRRNVWRLVPNHFLDLGSWETKRHWPRTELPERDIGDVVSTVVDRVRLSISGLVEKLPALVRLTAGRDSRMLLACARPYLDRITLFTAEHLKSDETSWLDCAIASRISHDLRLRHVRLSRRPPTRHDLDEWLFRTGWSVGEEKGRQAVTTFKSLPPGHVDLVALCGELSRAEHWPEQLPDFWTPHPGETEFRRDQLVDFFMNLYFPLNGGRHPRSLSVIEAWLESVEPCGLYFAHDLFYIEQRLGTWGGVYPYGFSADGRFQLFPFSHREIFEAMMSLPTEVRLADGFTRALIESSWPELLEYPFNRPHGLQRLKATHFRALRFSARARRAASDPVRSTRRMVERLRQHDR
jgi:hypothetical protein